MNVTPLVDVVLVLLIIFMVVTPLLAKQFWINLPDKKEDQEPPPGANDDGPIVVTVDDSGQIRINREVVPDDQFETRLHRVLAAKRQRTIFFDAQNDAEFGRAVDVLDKARGGGAAKIAVMTEPLPIPE